MYVLRARLFATAMYVLRARLSATVYPGGGAYVVCMYRVRARLSFRNVASVAIGARWVGGRPPFTTRSEYHDQQWAQASKNRDAGIRL